MQVRIALLTALLFALPVVAVGESETSSQPDAQTSAEDSQESGFALTSFFQPAPLPGNPEIRFDIQSRLPEVSSVVYSRFFAAGLEPSSLSQVRVQRQMLVPNLDFVLGLEAKSRAATDVGNLLKKAPTATGVQAQQRTPVVTDPRSRGSRVGALVASGSHWIPARIDLDTMLSKIDSRILSDVIVIKGPYSVRNGPGFQFMDFQLKEPQLSRDGRVDGGLSSIEFKHNGEQVYGRQEVWTASDAMGLRVGYGHRTGNDYDAGNGAEVAASYNSRDWDASWVWHPSETSKWTFTYLRLDQTGMEFPGQAFDIDYLGTDGFELQYEDVCGQYYDRLVGEAWYNRTRFFGNANSPSKREQFPFYNVIDFSGTTDVDSMSVGYLFAASWGDADCAELTVGTDLRYTKQELNEITSGRFGLTMWTDANSPIPRSEAVDPGLFAELHTNVTDRLSMKVGVRGDLVTADIVDDAAKLVAVGTNDPQSTYAETVGTDQFRQSFPLLSAHVTGEYELNSCWAIVGGAGYAERAPNMTELYAAEPFMFLLQNGLNTVSGDPLLDRERRWQVDLGLNVRTGRLRGGVNGFHAWVNDYITFENIGEAPPFGTIEQVNLRYVNTALATFVGAELYAEYDASDWVTGFATFQYVDGRDEDRNGNFATDRTSGLGDPTVKVPGLPRGFFSTTAGDAKEPLPSISPMEGRLGLRLHEPTNSPLWALELSLRLVDNQDRVAASLLETPTPGFAVWDLRGYWKATDRLLLVAGVENFTDRNYREHLDFRSLSGNQLFQPGINFYLSTEVTY